MGISTPVRWRLCSKWRPRIMSPVLGPWYDCLSNNDGTLKYMDMIASHDSTNCWMPVWWALRHLWWSLTECNKALTYWGRVTHICVSKLTIIGSDKGLSSGRRQESWHIINSNLRNKLQWNFRHNSCIFIQENAFENVVWKMAAICLGLNVIMYLFIFTMRFCYCFIVVFCWE